MFSSIALCFGTMLKTITGISQKNPGIKPKKDQNVVVLRTNDVVNADLARLWCDEHGLLLQVVDQRDELFPAEAWAMVIDLDHLALKPSERAHFVERLVHVLPPCPVAVASYNLEPPTMAALRDRGMLVFRRLERQLFYELASSIDRDVADSAA
jgi:hypothetical protein